ncbi:MAG: hypothetical protein OWQ50_07060 [Acidianus infernus]|nr:hypothetical protein [Acidianus infernus]
MKKQEKRRQTRGNKKATKRDKSIKSMINKISIVLMIISFPFLLDIWLSAFIEGYYSVNYVAIALGLFTLSFILRTITMRS